MDDYQINRLARVFSEAAQMHAVCAEIEGMKAENAHRLGCDLSIAYGDEAFTERATLLRSISDNLSSIAQE